MPRASPPAATAIVESFSGVAPGARILPVRFTTRAGPQALDLPHAIEYAVEMGASVVNVSHAGDVSLPAVQRAIQYAATRNALVVCSASDAHAQTFPDEETPNLISVLSVDDQMRPLANYPASGAHIAAPGFARVPHWRASGHSSLVGAAIGAPYVSGCAALVKALNPGWGYHEIKEHLVASGDAAARASRSKLPVMARRLNVANAVLGPLELADDAARRSPGRRSTMPTLRWKLRYRAALCVNAVALYRPHGDEHWRELAFARARHPENG